MSPARIRQRIKSSMQSGRATTGSWVLEFEAPQGWRADPLTGWAGSGDTQGQVSLTFPTLEAATAYAEKHGIPYHVTANGTERSLKLQAYADNFKGPDLSF
jgi:hypothetical protein